MWKRDELPVLTLEDADKIMDVRNELSDFVDAWHAGFETTDVWHAKEEVAKILKLLDEVISTESLPSKIDPSPAEVEGALRLGAVVDAQITLFRGEPSHIPVCSKCMGIGAACTCQKTKSRG